jgi:flagellar biosynthesis/type III secretory pathway chaperone
MANDLLDTIRSLAIIMREETELLQSPRRSSDLPELAAAKQRLVALLDARTAQLARENSEWLESLEAETRAELLEAIAELKEASSDNAIVLERHIQLTVDMMAAITAEARRISGTRHAVYGAAGGLSRLDLPTPISVNSRF